ncbi:OmpA family protein [Niveispirillum sp.]|uniref:OmpA family protein n=1 Tax=Niveispirillum sp. TaxID=1917217 RepID=UPI001B529D6D|nr:OmpA family protein [Niveispirillum sp.]MBP7337849.1 OmpA family protein [Niveispirillum sp.]
MSKITMIYALPIGLLLLAGCTGSNVSSSSPGYVALKAGNYAESTRLLEASNIKWPNSPIDELNLGASYQSQGRMDLAEPFLRRAMTHGHGLMPTETTRAWAKGMTVEEVACQNLALGLAPATIEGTATPCQTTLVVAVIAAPGPVAAVYRQTSYNTYFDFDKATLTPDGVTILRDAAKEILNDPDRRVTLVGKASSIGTDYYNMDLSRQRVETVRNTLIAAGVASSRIDVRWVGSRELPVPQADGVRQPLNRVVEGVVK